MPGPIERVTFNKRLSFCPLCRGTGVRKLDSQYVKCQCGRLPNSVGAARLAKQERLIERFNTIKEKGWV
jgi:hypothetical protein